MQLQTQGIITIITIWRESSLMREMMVKSVSMGAHPGATTPWTGRPDPMIVTLVYATMVIYELMFLDSIQYLQFRASRDAAWGHIGDRPSH